MQKHKNNLFIVFGILVVLVFVFKGLNTQDAAYAFSDMPESSNIKVTTIQLGRDTYGIAMIDPDTEKIWIYEVNKSSSTRNRLKLIAARSWKYDKMLDNYNTADPTPAQVKGLLEKMSSSPKPKDSKGTERAKTSKEK